MIYPLRSVWPFVAMVGCSSRGGYAEPGPLSPNASPPSPASIHSGGVLQPSTSTGTGGEHPPAVNVGGAQVAGRGDHGNAQSPSTECVADSDCVASSCCHPSGCAPASRVPSCAGVACSQACAPGSLDCGQGRCACVAGRCGAVRRATP
jgi:hypothetical protein